MRISKIIAGIMAFCIMGMACPVVNGVSDKITAYASSEYTEGAYEKLTYKNYGDYIEISDCDESATDVIIPSEIDGVTVTSIGFDAFYACSSLMSVKIPESVQTIGGCAFLCCKSLKSITIPDSVTSIEYGAFSYCNSLMSITIPESVTSIGSGAFSDCKSLILINVSENNSYYSSENGILFNKDKTELIQYPSGKTETEYVVPDGIKYINNQFRGSNLESIVISRSVKNVEYKLFAECFHLMSVTILNSDCKIDYSTFSILNGNFKGTIYGYENSTAQVYAEEHNYKFKSLGQSPDKETPTGDINGDGEFNIADAVLLNKYLLGGSDEKLSEWQNADFCADGRLDSFDLCMMKKKLVEDLV